MQTDIQRKLLETYAGVTRVEGVERHRDLFEPSSVFEGEAEPAVQRHAQARLSITPGAEPATVDQVVAALRRDG